MPCMFSILLSIPESHWRVYRCTWSPGAASNGSPSPSPSTAHKQNRNWKRRRPVLDFWVKGTNHYLEQTGRHFAISVMSYMLTWQPTSWNIWQNLIKQIDTVFYRFSFNKTPRIKFHKPWSTFLGDLLRQELQKDNCVMSPLTKGFPCLLTFF